MDCVEERIEIEGFSIGVKRWNLHSKRVVLCLHGYLDNAGSFDLIAPYFPELQLIAIDSPGTGLSSAYADGVLPCWKNDAFLIMQAVNKLEIDSYDIIGHSLGALSASVMAIIAPEKLGKLIFLDVMGPKLSFLEDGATHLQKDFKLVSKSRKHSLYKNVEEAIQTRMKVGNISRQAATALVKRGTVQTEHGVSWTFDEKLYCIASTLPYEDELRAVLKGILAPVYLIRANQGLQYPPALFSERTAVIKDFHLEEVEGGHHVHMDDPKSVAEIISRII